MSSDLYSNSSISSSLEKIPENISEEDVLYWAEKIAEKVFDEAIRLLNFSCFLISPGSFPSINSSFASRVFSRADTNEIDG